MAPHSAKEVQPSASRELPAPVTRVLDAAKQADLPYELREMTQAPQSPADIAEFCEAPADAIARIVLFKGKASRKPVLVIGCGEHRIDERMLASVVGEVLEKADADFVLRHTGYGMEGLPPIGIVNRIAVLMDIRLTRFQQIWCPAGTPGAFFMAPTRPLARMAAARIVPIS